MKKRISISNQILVYNPELKINVEMKDRKSSIESRYKNLTWNK